jgi:hypothetical protein
MEVYMQKLIDSINTTDKFITHKIKDIHLVLFNLEIEQAKLKEVNGIKPIADYLERTVKELEDYLNISRKQVKSILENEKF